MQRILLVSLGAMIALSTSSCSSSEGLGDLADIACGPQTGMSGELSSDLPGVWRLDWSGPADGGPSSFLIAFESGGSAELSSQRFGRQEWSWSVNGSEVRMFAQNAADLQAFRMTWEFASGEWTWSAIGYGETELQRCNAAGS